MDRPLAMTVGVSLACHAVVVGLQLIGPSRGSLSLMAHPAKVIYDTLALRDDVARTIQEARRAQAQLTDVREFMGAPAHRADLVANPAGRTALTPGLSGSLWQAHVSSSGAMSLPASAPSSDTSPWATAVDLTNLTAAAQGNPVLLSYLSAIREQIQRTANQQGWIPTRDATSGMICIGFVMTRTGRIQSVTVLPDRSVGSPQLQQIALKMIQVASPFPPFPPSFSEPSKTFVVPIEFLIGS